jgi:phosphatidate cytidylyltransferase
MTPPLITVGFGFLFLLAVTIAFAVLKSKNPSNKTFSKVWEILGGWWIIISLLSIACLAGSNGLIVLFFAASLLALKEFLGVQKPSLIGRAETIGMILLTLFHYLFLFLQWKNVFLFLVPVMTYVYLPFFLLARRKIDGLIYNLWSAQSGLMLCVYFLSFAPGLFLLNVYIGPSPKSIRTIDPVACFLFLFIITEMNDVFQFASGKLFGKHKLAVELSPNKTIEGFAGGIFLSTLLSGILAPIMIDLSLYQAMLVGICVSLSGVSGDLMFSAIKRTAGVKDFSNLIPGHGGVLDRLDSLIFTAPTLYCLLYLLNHASG